MAFVHWAVARPEMIVLRSGGTGEKTVRYVRLIGRRLQGCAFGVRFFWKRATYVISELVYILYSLGIIVTKGR